MKFIGNIIWVLFGGFAIALEYVASSAVLILTIIGIPFGLQTLKLAVLALWPFGMTVVPSSPGSGGCLNTLMSVIWWFVGGIPIALTHLALGVVFCLTVIGIPFGLQHFKLMGLALMPFGKDVVKAQAR